MNPNAKLLRPPVPICQQESNWPLLTISKGFFDTAIAQRPGIQSGTSAAVTLPASVLQVANVDLSAAGKTWDEDGGLDLDEDGGVRGEGEDGGGEHDDSGADKGWDVDDGELEIPADLVASPGSTDNG